MLTKTQRKRLEQVCLVLFPKYKRVIVNNLTRIVTLYLCKTPIIRWFLPKWKITLTELINYQIPLQLADFRHGNPTFISIIQEDLVRCKMTKCDPIDYFLDEIRRVKFVDVYKGFGTVPKPINAMEFTNDDNELFQEMLDYHERKKQQKTHVVYRSSYNRLVTWFYVSLILIIVWVTLLQIKL